MVPVDNSQLVPMQPMCAADDLKILCIIKDLTNPQWQQCKITVNLPATTTCKELCEEVARQANYEAGTFSLVWQRGGQDGGDDVPINDRGKDILLDLGMLTDNKKNLFQLGDKDGEQPVQIEVGATGVTVTQDDNTSTDAVNDSDASPVITSPTTTTSDYGYGGLSYASAVISKSDTGFVGLVNQAMTCYLNSLLQTLYMTPEFRHAIYKWENGEKSEDPSKSIPYQLQRLFVQLQTSKKRAVETTDVTKSFGWDSSEAWQQHDVQELCRVMFDALERNWKNTDQANLINQLYQGQMKDYVKCLECNYESARSDAFLDIPLVIRPFGATQAYGSVEKAMRSFVTPETLDGSNQYYCEKCNKKCDAHKGLRFLQFPYLLTLQLKRFDFDYNTMHRIKLNDKMTFPEILDLNDFIEGSETIENGVAKPEPETESQTDSGAENEDSCPSNQSSESTDEGIDEGIDVEQAATAAANDRNEKKRQQTGPYNYELFSIMVHSGTAAGGHYYAYIKSFSDGQWYCYNDQQVTCVTYDDIRKTYGGNTGSYRGYYSSNYTSSTNAYMLMYRQIDHKRNKAFVPACDFPDHIEYLSHSIVEDEANEKRQREIERNTCKIKLFAVDPTSSKALETRLEVHKDKTLAEATEMAYELLGFDKILPLAQCRLVKYEEFHESLEMSYDDEEETPMGQLLGGVKSSYMFDLMMETRLPDQQFQIYKVGGITIKLYEVELEREHIRNPISMRAYTNMTINDFKTEVSQITGLPLENMRVVLEKYYTDLRLLTVPNKSLKAEGFLKSNKVFVEGHNLADQQLNFPESRLHQLLDRYANTIRLFVTLPPALSDGCSSVSDMGSGCASMSSSPSDKYSDLNVDTSLLSPNKAPTPSPTGSTSTLSDDQPLDKNHMNLLGSETDSGVVSLSETRIGDDHIALLGEEGTETPPLEDERGEPDGAPCPLRTGQGDADNTKLIEGFGDNFTLKNVTSSEAVQQKDEMSLPTSPESNNVSSTSTSQIATTSPTSHSATTTRSSTTSDLSCPLCQLSSSSSCEECNKIKSPMQDSSAPASSLSLSSIDSHLTASSGTTSSETGAEQKLDSGQGEAAGVAYDDGNGDSEEEIYENTRRKQKVWYFRADQEQEMEGERILPVHLDKRMTLRAFKRALEPYVGATIYNFKVYRVYANSQEFESFRLNETLQTYIDDGKVIIKHGRALKKGEYRVKVFQLLVNETEPLKHILDWVFAKGQTVLQSKKELLPELKSKCGIDIPIERLRLRKKAWKNPGSIYMDTQKYEDDIPIFTNWEVFLEVLQEPEPIESPSQLVLLTRRWRPAEFKLDPFHEVVIDDGTAEELKKQISVLSEIPEERVEFAKGKGTFPCEVSLLEMQTDLEWDPQVTSLNSYPLYISDDGAVIYYRDSEEELKELSEDQKRELQKKESARLAKTGQRINYSPRKERALKIYTDSPPSDNAATDK